MAHIVPGTILLFTTKDPGSKEKKSELPWQPSGIRLPMQETQVWSLVRQPWSIEAHEPQLSSLCSRGWEAQLLSPWDAAAETRGRQLLKPGAAAREAATVGSPHTAAESSSAFRS